jgi:hypothetical protein
VEQQIDELRDLDVVDGDLGLVVRCNDQVLLRGSFQFETPSGYAVDTTTGEIGIPEIGADQGSTLEVSLFELRPAEVRIPEESPEELRPAEVCSPEVRPVELRRSQVRPAKSPSGDFIRDCLAFVT